MPCCIEVEDQPRSLDVEPFLQPRVIDRMNPILMSPVTALHVGAPCGVRRTRERFSRSIFAAPRRIGMMGTKKGLGFEGEVYDVAGSACNRSLMFGGLSQEHSSHRPRFHISSALTIIKPRTYSHPSPP